MLRLGWLFVSGDRSEDILRVLFERSFSSNMNLIYVNF